MRAGEVRSSELGDDWTASSHLARNEDGTLGPEHIAEDSGRELEPKDGLLIVRLSGGDLAEAPPAGVEVRQYHLDFRGAEEPHGADEAGPYEVLGVPVCADCGKLLSGEDLASTDPSRCDSCETQRSYDFTSADVVLPLATGEAMAMAEALELFAGIDEGENTDRDELLRLAALVRRYMEEE